jgi:hypothetical protein
MSFPSSPINGQTTIVNGITYIYNATNNAWKRQTATSITLSGNLTANRVLTTELSWSSNSQPYVESIIGNYIPAAYDLDDLGRLSDGFRIVFRPTLNLVPVAISYPTQLTIAINGVLQSAFTQTANTELVWQSNFFPAYKGYTIDTNGNIKFAEAPAAGSQIYARTTAGTANTTTKTYPFKPVDIMVGI